MDLTKNLENKLNKLISFLKNKKVIVAFSGGVDSSLLAFLSNKNAKKTLLITEKSPLYPEEEIDEVNEFAKNYEIPNTIIERNPLIDNDFKKNPKDRCYICKKGLYSNIIKIRDEKNFDLILDGSNTNDLEDYRPGMQALRELGIITPYIDFNINKQEIREICRYFNLDVQFKPSMACFSSRIPYDQVITEKKLNQIRESEKFLKQVFNLKQLRVRYHDDKLARIEFLREDLPNILTVENLQKIIRKFKDLGFCYITIDIEGFRSGSINEVL
ncbi:MAG: ATP-dependent sacrificial sulfur transferase LarE [Promethearchaeota archaeon]